jgi:Xaa-Pro aminopeptidase
MVLRDLVIPRSEHKARLERVRNKLSRARLAALYLTNPTRILYATGFSHISTERPLAVVIPREGPVYMLGPHLEKEHVQRDSPLIDENHTYPDYPGSQHPIRYFAKTMASKGLASSRIGTDSFEGAAGGWGYRGPPLFKVMNRAEFVDGRDIIDNMRLVKSNQELRLLRESSRWAEAAHDILLENVHPNTPDSLVGLKASLEGLGRMLRKLGAKYKQLKWGLSPVVVGFRGQVGPESAIPHAVFSKRKIHRGDVLVTEAGVEIGGYTTELERTVIVGKPSPRARRYFQTMLKAQTAALKAFRPGASCSSVDAAARKQAEADGVADCLRHHTGHGIGLDGHEPPWLDPGDRTRMKPGMVFSCEPGLYVPGYAGFRHSDTVAVTKSGMDLITDYPRELEDLTV